VGRHPKLCWVILSAAPPVGAATANVDSSASIPSRIAPMESYSHPGCQQRQPRAVDLCAPADANPGRMLFASREIQSWPLDPQFCRGYYIYQVHVRFNCPSNAQRIHRPLERGSALPCVMHSRRIRDRRSRGRCYVPVYQRTFVQSVIDVNFHTPTIAAVVSTK